MKFSDKRKYIIITPQLLYSGVALIIMAQLNYQD